MCEVQVAKGLGEQVLHGAVRHLRFGGGGAVTAGAEAAAGVPALTSWAALGTIGAGAGVGISAVL